MKQKTTGNRTTNLGWSLCPARVVIMFSSSLEASELG
jgi:hypothetical protein